MHEPSRKLNIEYGNTQVTCHVGVPSCGQRHRNLFIDLLLTCTITNTIINHSLASPPCASSPALFLLPTLPLLYYLSPCVLFPLKPNPVEEDWWKGFIRPVHRPSPRGAVDVKSTTPTHPVDYQVNTLVFTCDGANIRKIILREVIIPCLSYFSGHLENFLETPATPCKFSKLGLHHFPSTLHQ